MVSSSQQVGFQEIKKMLVARDRHLLPQNSKVRHCILHSRPTDRIPPQRPPFLLVPGPVGDLCLPMGVLLRMYQESKPPPKQLRTIAVSSW